MEVVAVGTIVTALEPPGKHWQEMVDGVDPIADLTSKLDSMRVTWSPEWDLDRLEYELSRADYWAHQKRMLEDFGKVDGAHPLDTIRAI